MTTFGDQVFEFGGAPVGSGRFSSPWATHYFVDYDNGSDNNPGKRPDDAKQTIQAAVTAASGGDVIYVNPRAYQWAQGFRRYVEDIAVAVGDTTGSGNVSDNANMSLIGVTPRRASAGDINGVRLAKATATPVTVSAHAFHMENIDIFAEGATYAVDYKSTAWTIGSDGSSMYNCTVKGAMVTIEGGADLAFVGCRFHCAYDGVVGGITFEGGVNHQRPLIKNCEFLGGVTDAGADGPWITHTDGSLIYQGCFRDLYFAEDPDGGVAILMRNQDAGLIENVYFAMADASSAITAGGMNLAGIYDAGGFAI